VTNDDVFVCERNDVYVERKNEMRSLRPFKREERTNEASSSTTKRRVGYKIIEARLAQLTRQRIIRTATTDSVTYILS